MSGGTSELEKNPELFSWYKKLNLRAYRVTNDEAVGKTVHELEGMFPARVVVDKIKRDNQVMDPRREMIIRSGDIVAIVGDRSQFLNADRMIGPEVADKDIVNIIGEILDVCVLNRDAVGKTLGDISAKHGQGCFLRKLTRQGHELPLAKNTVLHNCDILHIAGAKKDVDKFVTYIGYPERPTMATDLVTVGAGCVFGTLLGLVAVKIAGIPLTLGVGGGVLISGLVFGWLRSIHPTFGQIPNSAQWLLTDMGLNIFIACVGLIAGPKAISALQATGGTLFLAGVIVTLVPHITGIAFGRLVLKMNPVLLLGGLTGSGTVTPALNALKEESGSSAPAIGYTVCYAFGNVILTIWGSLIINVMK